jgi:diguanylate cyclase (GGDEF)-like protein
MAISSRILNARILIVDDSEVNVKLLEYMLAGAGYVSVSSTTDSRRVFELYKEHRYDIILLDLNMPHMDGFQVMESLKTIETEGYLPVLVVTAEPGHKLRALQAGAKDFVSKPIDQTEVLTRVHNMLEIRLMHKDLRNRNESLTLQVSEQTAELRAAAEKVSYLSNFDSITGLPNRILLRDRVRRTKERIARAGEVMGFLVVDLVRLPLIRGSLGIKAEQDVLTEVAARLEKWIQPEDTVARFGDDSLAVVVVRSAPEDLAAAAHQIVGLLDKPFHFNDQELHVEACIGIAIFPNDGDDFDFLAQAAEASMRTAMTSKAQRCLFYTPELNRHASDRLKLENALRRALERDELLLHYQPQLDLTSGTVIGLEALIRWQHPELGLVPPGRFIGLAEDTGLILPIGEWVLFRACSQNKAWQDAGLPAIPVAVNLSSKQFSGNIASLVQTVLAETGLDPRYLELELTESLSMEDPESTIGILRKLKNMGVRLSIDDFGTGYSNLNYLKRFPVDKLKLDQSFVRELISDPDDLSIARAVIAMAHSLRLKVIAEGVETEGQLALLAQNGCDEMQGYLFSRPIDVIACAALLQQGKSLALGRIARRPYTRTLLFVDDEKSMGTAIHRTLRNRGYTILITDSAAEAFEILATNEVGVILCDQRMPGMSGTEFLSRVKHMYPSAVRMVLSGYTDLQSVTDAVNHGAIFKFLTKPWEEEELLKALDDAFRKYES